MFPTGDFFCRHGQRLIPVGGQFLCSRSADHLAHSKQKSYKSVLCLWANCRWSLTTLLVVIVTSLVVWTAERAHHLPSSYGMHLR